MLFKLMLLFTVVPIIELMLLFRLSRYIGFQYTIIIVLVTGVVGAFLAKREGKGIIKRIKVEISDGRVPGDELINGLCVIVGGAMLLTPGIITDAAGFILVISPTRKILITAIKRKIKNMIQDGTVSFYFKR